VTARRYLGEKTCTMGKAGVAYGRSLDGEQRVQFPPFPQVFYSFLSSPEKAGARYANRDIVVKILIKITELPVNAAHDEKRLGAQRCRRTPTDVSVSATCGARLVRAYVLV